MNVKALLPYFVPHYNTNIFKETSKILVNMLAIHNV